MVIDFLQAALLIGEVAAGSAGVIEERVGVLSSEEAIRVRGGLHEERWGGPTCHARPGARGGRAEGGEGSGSGDRAGGVCRGATRARWQGRGGSLAGPG